MIRCHETLFGETQVRGGSMANLIYKFYVCRDSVSNLFFSDSIDGYRVQCIWWFVIRALVDNGSLRNKRKTRDALGH